MVEDGTLPLICQGHNNESTQNSGLHLGDRCYIHHQTGNNPRRWNRSGTVVENNGHHSYTIKIDSSGRLTQRNCKFLRQFAPASHLIQEGNSNDESPLLPAPPIMQLAPPTSTMLRPCSNQPTSMRPFLCCGHQSVRNHSESHLT